MAVAYWLGILLAFLLGVTLDHLLDALKPERCPRCGRDLDPDNYRGFREGRRRFCWCGWEEGRDASYTS